MNLNNHIFDLAYYLLKPNIGQKHLKEIVVEFSKKKIKLEKSPCEFREMFSREKIKIIPYWSVQYPYLLKQTSDFPVFLFLKGDISLLSKKCITIVGTRKMDEYGQKILSDVFVRKKEFRKNMCFVSGLANGVDSEVHRLCLKNNLDTIGVMAGGMDKRYYRGNQIMYQYLSRYKLVIAEFPPGRKYFKGMFPLRNRILAGLSSETIVLQAGAVSGAINTASHANSYGRDVYIIPHDIYSDVGQGCLKLLSDGAGILKNIDEFVDKVRK